MFTAAMHLPLSLTPSPIQTRWDELFLPATRIKVAGATVAGADSFDEDELRVETTTIMFADVVESVRLIAQNEAANVVRIRALLKLLCTQVIPRYDGEVLERRGDGLLVKFGETRNAAACALDLHAVAASASFESDPSATIALRIGIHSSSVLVDESAIYGQGINLAARVAALAGPGETIASGSARDALTAGFDADIEDLGDCYVKHVSEPIRAFRLGTVGVAPVVPEGAAAKDESLPTIAVLPLTYSGDEQTRSVADLLGETLTHYLSRAGTMKVISWQSCRALTGRNTSAHFVGSTLDADWTVRGSCFAANARIVVYLELLRRESSLIEHSERALGDVGDLLESESALAASLASSITHFVTQSEARRVSQHALPSLSSHSLLLGAVGLMHRSGPADFHRSRDALEHLLDRQPRMHSARPWLAKWFVLRTTRGMQPSAAEEASRALDQTKRALDSQSDDAFALAIEGFIYFHMLRDKARASEKLAAAVALNPSEPLANVFNAALVSARGEFDVAWNLAIRALTLSPFDPLRPYMRMIAAACALSSERYVEAAELAEKSIRENAAHSAAWRTLTIALVQCGRLDAARAACARLMVIEPTLNLQSYAARLTLPDAAKARAIESLALAGVPTN